jgi:hypothetical protein
MTPKTTIEEPIPGNSLSSRRMHARIPQKSEPMIRQAAVFEKATAIRIENKNKNSPQGHHNIHLQRTHSQTNWKTTSTHIWMQQKQH